VLSRSSAVFAWGVKRGLGVEAPDGGLEAMVDCACAGGRGGRGFWRLWSRLGEKWKKVAYQEEAGQGCLAGCDGGEGAERLARFDSMGETTALLSSAMKYLPSTQQLLSSINTYTAEC
jgi:hypothetical protein